MGDIDRFFAFERRRHSLLSTRAVPFEGGVAYFDDDYPERYVSNLLLVDGDEGTLAGARLASLADDILGGAGFSHRHVTVQGAYHEALLANEGYARVVTESILDVLHAASSGLPLAPQTGG